MGEVISGAGVAMKKTNTPVLFIVFNRPDLTARVFDTIKRASPHRLYIASDGPREEHEEDCDKVEQVRAIVSRVDWDCQVKKLYREKNLGCKRAYSSAVDWFYENEEEGIILEDDCLPDPSFFRFCSELLEKYRYDERIVFISGDNVQPTQSSGGHSYYFSRYYHVWGWASWRRAWKFYDVKMEAWPEMKKKRSFEAILGKTEYQYWKKKFDNVFKGNIDTWDYQLAMAFWMQKGLSILPNVNLVSNIGFRPDATHTKFKDNSVSMVTQSMIFPLRHPRDVVRDEKKDYHTFTSHFKKTFWARVKNKWDILGAIFS